MTTMLRPHVDGRQRMKKQNKSKRQQPRTRQRCGFSREKLTGTFKFEKYAPSQERKRDPSVSRPLAIRRSYIGTFFLDQYNHIFFSKNSYINGAGSSGIDSIDSDDYVYPLLLFRPFLALTRLRFLATILPRYASFFCS